MGTCTRVGEFIGCLTAMDEGCAVGDTAVDDLMVGDTAVDD